MRLIDETGKQVGIVSLEEALNKSRESGLDLIQVTEKVDPPVCKIEDYGKYLYREGKKEKELKKQKGGVMKGIRLSFKISNHDLETKARQAIKFIKEGDLVRVELVLRGREKAHEDYGKEKINHFLEFVKNEVQIKTERDLKKDGRGFTVIISKE